jgi:hypothetical protein
MPSFHHSPWGHGAGIPPLFLGPRPHRSGVALPPARLAGTERRHRPAPAERAPAATPPHALHCTPSVCGPHHSAPLCPLGARSRASPTGASGATRAAAPTPAPCPHGGLLSALLSPRGRAVSRRARAGHAARHRSSPWGPRAAVSVHGMPGLCSGAPRHALPWPAGRRGAQRARAGGLGRRPGYPRPRSGLRSRSHHGAAVGGRGGRAPAGLFRVFSLCSPPGAAAARGMVGRAARPQSRRAHGRRGHPAPGALVILGVDGDGAHEQGAGGGRGGRPPPGDGAARRASGDRGGGARLGPAVAA